MEETKIKIEKGIPLPPLKIRGKPYISVLRSMEVGDSCLFPDRRTNFLGNPARRLLPMRFTARTVDGGCRVWRIE